MNPNRLLVLVVTVYGAVVLAVALLSGAVYVRDWHGFAAMVLGFVLLVWWLLVASRQEDIVLRRDSHDWEA